MCSFSSAKYLTEYYKESRGSIQQGSFGICFSLGYTDPCQCWNSLGSVQAGQAFCLFSALLLVRVSISSRRSTALMLLPALCASHNRVLFLGCVRVGLSSLFITKLAQVQQQRDPDK